MERDDISIGDCIRLLCVSRIDPRKGLSVLPDVVRRLVAAGHDVSLDIIGPRVGRTGERERAAIDAAAAAAGVGDRLRFIGSLPLDELMTRYRDYDVFVLPTLPGEGIPRVLLESMAAGVPIVTTAVAGIPSLVAHERNGLLVDEPSAAAVAGAILRAIENGDLRRRVIRGGFETARAHTVDRQAAWMMEQVHARMAVPVRRVSPVA